MLDLNSNLKFTILAGFIISLPLITYSDESMSTLSNGQKIITVKSINQKQPENELTILGFTLGRSILKEIQDKIPGKEIYHEGDAGKSIYRLCYKGTDGTFVTFESSEMGGRNHIMTSISISSLEIPIRFQKFCANSKLITKEIVVEPGIKLDLTKNEIQKLKGSPSKELTSFLYYEYQTVEHLSKKQIDILSTLELHFKKNKLKKLSISKIESY